MQHRLSELAFAETHSIGLVHALSAIESLIDAAPNGTAAFLLRTTADAEIDLLLKLRGQRARGFHLACDDVRPGRRLVVYGGAERFPLAEGVEAVSLVELCAELAAA